MNPSKMTLNCSIKKSFFNVNEYIRVAIIGEERSDSPVILFFHFSLIFMPTIMRVD